MLERDIVRSILRYLKSVKGCFAWKEHGGIHGTAGIPDIICCVHGRFVALEVKQPGGQLTALQRATIQRINETGGIARKVTSVEEVREIIQKLQEGLSHD